MLASRFFRKILTVTSSEQIFGLPRLREIAIKNIGDVDCKIEFDNTIDDPDTSMTAEVDVAYNFGASFNNLHYKTASGTTTLLILGIKMQED